MINFRARSYCKELLDSEDIPFADIRKNMEELNTINTYLGGHKISIKGIKKLLQDEKINRPLTICEIGCGGGDNLRAIEKWCNKHSVMATFIGIDIKQECIEFAQQQYPGLNSKWITSDFSKVDFGDDKPDIIFSSLFCHHFINGALVKMLQWMKTNAAIGFFINDLHRNATAYFSIKIITRIFSKSYLVKNDAPLSVARGFKKKEWQRIIAEAEISNCSVEWKWAFRHLIVCSA